MYYNKITAAFFVRAALNIFNKSIQHYFFKFGNAVELRQIDSCCSRQNPSFAADRAILNIVVIRSGTQRLTAIQFLYKHLNRRNIVIMFEARLGQATILKKILDAIKDLLNEGTFDCSDSGIQVTHKKHICFS